MSLRRLMAQPVTIRRFATTTDRYNATVRSTASETSAKAWVTQTGSTELTDQRDGTATDWLAYLPAGTDIVAGDQLVHDGTTFEVDGKPLRARTPRGEHHVEVRLRVVEG